MWVELWEQVSGAVALLALCAAIVATVYAAILGSAARWVAHIDVPFGLAYSTTLISWFMQAVAQVIIGGIGAVAKTPEVGDLLVIVLAGPASLFAQAWTIKWRLYVPFPKGLVISLLIMVIIATLAALSAIGFKVVAYSL